MFYHFKTLSTFKDPPFPFNQPAREMWLLSPQTLALPKIKATLPTVRAGKIESCTKSSNHTNVTHSKLPQGRGRGLGGLSSFLPVLHLYDSLILPHSPPGSQVEALYQSEGEREPHLPPRTQHLFLGLEDPLVSDFKTMNCSGTAMLF